MKNFKDLNISEPVLRAILELGYDNPTPIQAETLPLLLGNDTDFLGLAATGTGKTAAFGIPLLERINRKTIGVQALILCPTRELAVQVAGQIDLLGKYIGIKSLPIYGGTGYGDQIYGLKAGANVVVGTPGRVVDHIKKGTLKLDKLKTLILDEADEMISMGFKEDLETVLEAAPEGQANIWLFSATMGRDVQGVANDYLNNPQRVQVNRTEMLSETVQQIIYRVHEYDKPQVLCKLIDAADDFYGIVFCQTKALVADLQQFLVGQGYRVDCLHGDLDQTSRDRVMKAFRDRKISILIATDVACRGLDVKDVTHVINYSIPRELDNYVHRIGRTARSGKQGLAFSLVTPSHRHLVGQIERMTKSRMIEGVIPSFRDLAQKRLGKVRADFEGRGSQTEAQSMLADDWKNALELMSKEEIVGRFLGLLLPDMFGDNQRPAPRAEAPAVRTERSDSPKRSFKPKFAEKKRFSPRPEGRPERSFAPRSDSRPEGRPERSFAPRPDSRPAARFSPRPEAGRPPARFSPRPEGRFEGRKEGKFEGRHPVSGPGNDPGTGGRWKSNRTKPGQLSASTAPDAGGETRLKKKERYRAGTRPNLTQ
jgi:ATP-dependent RNA helicase DeaD